VSGFEAVHLTSGGCGHQAEHVVIIERFATGNRVEHVTVHTDDEVTGQIHALDGDVGARSDRYPDRRARDGNARAAFEDVVEVVSPGVAASRAAQPEAVAK